MKRLFGALYYYIILTLSQSFKPMAAPISMKPALPLAKIIATVACRNCNIELSESRNNGSDHNVVIAWKYFPRY